MKNHPGSRGSIDMSSPWARGSALLRVGMACLAGLFTVAGAQANYADTVADHVKSINIFKGYTHDVAAQRSEPHPGGEVEAETDTTVTQIIVQPPAPAAAFTLEQDQGRADGRQDNIQWESDFNDGATAFDALPDGNYTVTFQFTDDSSAAVTVPFTHEDSSALQIPAQIPTLNRATAEGLVTGGPDITFSWPACTDPAATGIHFGIDGDFGILSQDYETIRSLAKDTEAQHRFDPDPDLPAGVFECDLAFADYRADKTTEGIDFEVAKYREQEFTLVVSQPDAGLQQHLSSISLSLGTAPGARDDSLHFHAEVHTKGQVQTLAMSVPNFWVDDNERWNWQQKPEQDGTKTWTLDEPFTSLQDFLDRYGFGPFGVYLQWNDGAGTVSRMTHIYFSAAAGTLTPLELPQQDPQFTAPAAGAFLVSPVTFQWNAWSSGDPAYTSDLSGIRFAVGNAPDTEGVVDAFLDKTAIDSGPRVLADGNYRAALYFRQLRQGATSDGIPASCMIYREAVRDFSVGQAGQLQVHIEPQAVHALGAQWSIDGGTVWHDPDETVSLAPGQYTIHCNAPNWNLRAPTDAVVTVVAGQTVQQTMTYGQVVLSIDAMLLIENGRHVADISAETGPEITGIHIETTQGKSIDLVPNNTGRSSTMDWRYLAEDLADFSEYGDGIWTVSFTLADQSQHSLGLRFGHSDEAPLQMPAQAPSVQQPAVAHQRARMIGPDLTFQWTPYTGMDANVVHINLESRGTNVFEDDHWTQYEENFDALLGTERTADPGTCTFTNVPGGVYGAGFYLGDAEESVTSELIDVTVAKAQGTLIDLLVSVPNDPLNGIVDSVQLRRWTVTSVNQSISGLFRADITPASGATIAGIRLRSPADEWLQLQNNAQTGHWTTTKDSTATISQRFPSGFYDLEVQYNDGQGPAYGTLGVEAVEADLADLAEVIQVPELTAPGGQTTSPVDFSWTACTDPAATATLLQVRGAAVENEWQVQQILASTVNSVSGVALDPAAYVARLVFLRRIPNVSRDIAMDVGFGRAADFPFTVTGAVSTTDVVLELQPGWNLISLPVTPYPQSDPEVIFAGNKLGPVWTWNGPLHSFEIATVLEAKRGYWVYASVAVPTQITISGTVLYDGNIYLAQGWNLVGAVLGPEGHVDVPSGCYAWGWDGSRYQLAHLLEYVRGYWMYCPVPGGQNVNLGD